MAIRVDASSVIGVGHLIRCLTLADALRSKGADVAFLTAPLPGPWAQAIQDRGFHAHTAPDDMAAGGGDDIRWSRECLAGRTWDWIVDDHYAIGDVWERGVAPAGARVFAIDDLADRPHHCHLLLDQNYLPNRDTAYRALTPAGTTLLLGPRYALLRPEYAGYRTALDRRPRPVRRVLVFFGGTDPGRLTEMALEALGDRACAHWDLDIVCGGGDARLHQLRAAADARGRASVSGPKPHLADLMVAADITIGSGGATTWERMCLGLASVVVTFAANQIPLADWLASQRLIVMAGAAEAMTPATMRDIVLRLAAAAATRDARVWPDIETGMALSDGHGVERVVRTMSGGAG